MRRLMWFAIGFGAACAFCAGTWIMTGLFVPALAFGAVFGAGILFGRRNKLFVLAAVWGFCGSGFTAVCIFPVRQLPIP